MTEEVVIPEGGLDLVMGKVTEVMVVISTGGVGLTEGKIVTSAAVVANHVGISY